MTSVGQRLLYHLPESIKDDLATFQSMVGQFKSGEITSLRFRAFRVPFGVYEQRELGTYMLRVRLPAGILQPQQMRAVARVSAAFGNGVLHLTTRQDIQVHGVHLESIHPALVSLYEAGLSTKGGGGNTVRNITACYDAGVCPHEAFDVTPYALALTEYLLPDPLSFQLPRKYKIAFSGCSKDCPAAMVNDLGLIAKRRGDQNGFRVYVGGGMGSHSRVGEILEDFVPAGEVHLVAEAAKRVFDQHGNRKDKHRARIRFLIEQVGLDAFRDWYKVALRQLLDASPPQLDIRALPGPQTSPPERQSPSLTTPLAGFEDWRGANALPQKQGGFWMVQVPLVLGDIQADAVMQLASVVEEYGEGILRAEQHQNAYLRWVPEDKLAELHARLMPLGLAEIQPPILRNLVSCTGASTCQLGICLSRGLAEALSEDLAKADLDLHSLGDIDVHISGCPNSCGRHPIAQVGFVGAARRVGGRLAPHYVAVLGGRLGEGRARLSERIGTVPAREAPGFLRDLLTAFSLSPQFPDFDAFACDPDTDLGALVAEHSHVPAFEQDKNPYYDWGADQIFSLAGRGPGECSAGVFDLIEADLESAREALEAGNRFEAAALACQALLVTRGEQPNDALEAFSLFERHFIDEDLIDPLLAPLVSEGVQAGSSSDPDKTYVPDAERVGALIAAVQDLYDRMDPSLRFPSRADGGPSSPAPQAVSADSSRDFRGVICPLNYVKTTMALGSMQGGQTLEVLLDEEGAENVPESASKDGHEVLLKERRGDHWRVLIRKGTGGGKRLS